jgi:hypothetical protein
LSTGDATKILQILQARQFIVSAVVAGGPAAEPFGDFLCRFYRYDESLYIRDMIAHGQRIGRTHASQSLERARKHWLPYFTGKRLGEVARTDVRDFGLHLADPNLKLAPNTRNRILVVGTTALKWAYNN